MAPSPASSPAVTGRIARGPFAWPNKHTVNNTEHRAGFKTNDISCQNSDSVACRFTMQPAIGASFGIVAGFVCPFFRLPSVSPPKEKFRRNVTVTRG